LAWLTSTELSQNTIYALNSLAGSCLDYHLPLVFVHATSAVANGMWCQVHPDNFAVMVTVVILTHHTLFYYYLYYYTVPNMIFD
jgi:hypothetical protein